MAVTITNHGFERYAERILSIPVCEIPEYLKQPENKEMIQRQIESQLEMSTFVTKATYHSQENSIYHIYDGIVFVLNSSGQALVTCYGTEFGFGAKMDRLIIKDLLEQIESEKEVTSRIEEETVTAKLKNDGRIEDINRQIESLESQLENLKITKQSIESHNKALVSKQVLANDKLKQLCYKLIYSINYNVDKLTFNKTK